MPTMKPNARMLLLAVTFLGSTLPVLSADVTYTPPVSPRTTYNFNANWKFMRSDVSGAQEVTFDDSKWETVSTPHTMNDVDSFRVIIDHSGGDRGTYKGISWYRKHFKLPASAAGSKVFIEFEGMRQAGEIYLNGRPFGLYENGVTAYGVDITSGVHFDQDNVLAVRVDNTTTYHERATDVPYRWNANDFNPDFGGINRRVWLHVTGKIYQTLPVYDGLGTTGTYIYCTNYDIAGKSCDVTVESQVQNAITTRTRTMEEATTKVALSATVVDMPGNVRATFSGAPVDVPNGEKLVLKATGHLANAKFWSPDEPNLYKVYTMLTEYPSDHADDGSGGAQGPVPAAGARQRPAPPAGAPPRPPQAPELTKPEIVDVVETTTGFRKTEFKGGVGTGGVYINGKFVYLKGFSQRTSDEWAGVGVGYPEWMHDFTAQLIRDDHANYMRWMHVAPQKEDVESYDRMGIVEVAPAADKEEDGQGRQWDQRAEVMRDTIIYLRNNPSILFWEAGNTGVTGPQMEQMVALRKEFDPYGGRVMGCRSLREAGAVAAAEWSGTMLSQPYSDSVRDREPLVETEDFRDEGARRFWDNFSPPYYGFKKGPNDTWNYNSETFSLAQIARYWNFYSNRISNTDPAHSKYAAYSSIYFNDSNADGRQDSSEVARVSGKVDAMRLPKEIYYTERVMQNEKPDIHIIGHWSYPPTQPDGSNTVKTMNVVANNVDSVELFVNGVSKGKLAMSPSACVPTAGPGGNPGDRVGGRPVPGVPPPAPPPASTVPVACDGYLYSFPNIAFAPGSIKAVGYKGKLAVATHTLTTAGPPAAIKLTLHTAPGGMRADGDDIALIDFEVVDAKGERCPTDDARVDFAFSAVGSDPASPAAIWRGGYNSGKTNTTNNQYLNTEDGINRVAVRSRLSPGKITVTASRDGLKSATVTFDSAPVAIQDGLSQEGELILSPFATK
jgi:beta-galactosidase